MSESENRQALNDKVLGSFKDNNQEVSVYLANGIKLSGKIIEFDKDSLRITSDAGPEGVIITRAHIATMTRRSVEDPRHRQEGNKSQAPVRRPTR